MPDMDKDRKVYSIIMAGGKGERLRPLVEQWLGYARPKQYCTFVGTRSMLQHTLDRAGQITPPDHQFTLVSRDQQHFALSELPPHRRGRMLVQPCDRGTAAAIFLTLTYVRKRSPAATVVIYPSDHFVYPEDRFLQLIRSTISIAQATKHWLILLGAPAKSPEPEYGWIQPGVHLGWVNGHRLRTADKFTEKPTIDGCRQAMVKGGLWNTLILAADLALLWDQGRRYLPKMMALLEEFAEFIGTSEEPERLDALYQQLAFHDFSSDLLQNIPSQIAVLELSGVLWSDWGKAERIVESLEAIGKTPAFLPAQSGDENSRAYLQKAQRSRFERVSDLDV
jgi:mannose-1-phosphate guanylyltransferase